MSLSLSPNVRFAIFVAAGAFFLFAPLAPRGPKWRMYRGLGVNYCQAEVHAVRGGARVELPPDAVVRAVGRAAVRTRRRTERFVLARKARENDILLANEGELAGVVKALCEAEPDVRAEMRCSPPYPGGKWRAIEDGATNLCARTKWPAPPSIGPQPNLDPETGEAIPPDAVQP
jgi:hypothetical protein